MGRDMIIGHRMDATDILFCHQVPGPLEVVARHQAGDRAQQGEGPVHTSRARLRKLRFRLKMSCVCMCYT